MQRGFFVFSGNVAINNLTIQNTQALGGTDSSGQGGGGGAGLGGALFVASGGNVTVSNVTLIKNNATLADGRFGRETDVAGPAADLTRSLMTRNGPTTCVGGCRIASVQKIGERLSFRDPGLAHAFIHALAPGEIGRIVGR